MVVQWVTTYSEAQKVAKECLITVAFSKWAGISFVPEKRKQQTAEPRLCMTGPVNGSIRRPGTGQVALTSGPLALNHCNDSPSHWEPVEIISSGPVSAEGRLAHCLPRKASQPHTECDQSVPGVGWGPGPVLNGISCKIPHHFFFKFMLTAPLECRFDK